MDLQPFLATFFMIAAAELGDKTQLLTLGFATRYPRWEVLSAVSLASAVLMALAVIFGGAITLYVPGFYIQFIAGFLFIIFGLWIILGKEKEEEKDKEKENFNPFIFIFMTFFLAELGDKTQLATFVLSAKYRSSFLVWLGATGGMVLINALAIFAGHWIKRFIPEKSIKWISTLIFIGFGVITLLHLFVK